MEFTAIGLVVRIAFITFVLVAGTSFTTIFIAIISKELKVADAYRDYKKISRYWLAASVSVGLSIGLLSFSWGDTDFAGSLVFTAMIVLLGAMIYAAKCFLDKEM